MGELSRQSTRNRLVAEWDNDDHLSVRFERCTCGDGSAEEDRGAVLRCPVHGIGQEGGR